MLTVSHSFYCGAGNISLTVNVWDLIIRTYLLLCKTEDLAEMVLPQVLVL